MGTDYSRLFASLDESLGEAGESLRVVCAGGFVLDCHDIRATRDIDAFFDCSPEISRIIREVGERYGANPPDEPWLNNSVQNMNEVPSADVRCDRVYEGANLIVDALPLAYVAGMKLESGRDQDVEDVALIIGEEHIDSPEGLLGTLEGYGFDCVDEGMLLEAFGIAYGIEWLESYYAAREAVLLRGGDGRHGTGVHLGGVSDRVAATSGERRGPRRHG